MYYLNAFHLRYILLAIFCATCSCTYALEATADVFQWTDEHGHVHFGDRPPKKSQPKNISKKLSKINITHELSSPEMMLRHEQNKEKEAKQRQKEWLKQRKNKPTRAKKCSKARARLKKVRGRVVFLDKQGNDLKRTEEERKEIAKNLENTIKKHCT